MRGKASMTETTRIGFIGLGGMGSRMAGRVLAAGYPLTVYNRTRDRATPLVEQGAEAAASPAELASRCQVIITMLSDPRAVKAVLEGETGILAGAHQGLILVDMSTVGPLDARATLAAAGARGLRVLNAPVLGTTEPAEKGELIILAGGEESLMEAQRPLLSTMGTTIRYLGGNEQACVAKLAVNAIMAGSMQLFGEAVALATHWGLPREQALEVLGASPAVSAAVKARIGTMFAPQDPSAFSLRLARKDLYLAVAAAYEKDASLPMTAAALQTFSMALDTYGNSDLGSIAAFVDEINA